MMDFHKKAKEVDKVYELFFRSWLRGNHEQGNNLLVAYGERCYRKGVEAMRDAAKVDWLGKSIHQMLDDTAARLLEPKGGEKET